MKKQIVLIVLLLVSGFWANAQESTAIGTFKLNSTASVHYVKKTDGKTDSVATAQIDSISLTIIDGTIRYITVFTRGHGEYYNRQTSISIHHYNDVGNDHYLCDKQDLSEGHYMHVRQALGYVPKHNGYIFPDEGEFMLRNESLDPKKFTAAKDVGMAHGYGIDLKTFTDAGALFGNKANGLVSVEGVGRVLMNNVPIFGSPIFLLQSFEIYGGYSKFDSKFATTIVPQDSILNRMEYFQKSMTTFGLRASLYKHYLNQKMELNLSTGFQWNSSALTPYSDTSRKSNGSIYSWITQADFSFATGYLFHVKLSPGLIYQGIDYAKNDVGIVNTDNLFLLNVKLLFAVNTSKTSNDTKIFFRLNYFKEINYKGVNGQGGDFIQYQIGYQKNFGDLFKTNTDIETKKNKDEEVKQRMEKELNQK